MVWVSLDDRVTLHEKFLSVGPEGFALWAGMLCYCNRSVTEGYVPKKHLDAYFPTLRGVKAERLAVRLVEEGLLIPTETGWFIHQYELHQPHAMRDVVREKEEAKIEKRRSDRERLAHKRALEKEAKSRQMALGLPSPEGASRGNVASDNPATRAKVAGDESASRDTPNHALPFQFSERERTRTEAGTPSDSGPSGPEPSDEQGEQEAPGRPAKAPEAEGTARESSEGPGTPPVGGQVARTTDGGPVGPAGSGPPTDSSGLELDGHVPSERELAFEAVGVLEPDGIPARGHPDYTAMVQVHKLICDGFRGRWEPRLALLWPGPKGKPALSEAFWVVRMVQKDPSLTHEGMVETMLDEWFDGPDPWPRNHRYPWNTFVNQMADAYVRAIDRARTREAEANEYRNDFGDLDDAAVH